jgi:hypothetical protein
VRLQARPRLLGGRNARSRRPLPPSRHVSFSSSAPRTSSIPQDRSDDWRASRVLRRDKRSPRLGTRCPYHRNRHSAFGRKGAMKLWGKFSACLTSICGRRSAWQARRPGIAVQDPPGQSADPVARRQSPRKPLS